MIRSRRQQRQQHTRTHTHIDDDRNKPTRLPAHGDADHSTAPPEAVPAERGAADIRGRRARGLHRGLQDEHFVARRGRRAGGALRRHACGGGALPVRAATRGE